MKKTLLTAAAIAVATTAIPAAAQDTVVVTGSRMDRSATNAYFTTGGSTAAIGLTRRADYFVTPLYVSSDTRDPDLRNEELFAMLGETITRAEAAGITLVAGRYTLMPVTHENMRSQPIIGGNRPDTSRVQIYARIPLRGDDPSVATTSEQIAAFVSAVPVTGRSFIDVGTTGLAIDNPEQYRDAVVRHIATEANRYANMFGNNYGIRIDGLDGDLYWQQSSETEIFLYINHDFTILPR